MSRLTYVRFCRPSNTGNRYICSEQAQHRARTIISHAAFDEDVLQRFFEKNPSSGTRAVGDAFGVDRRLVWNVVREQDVHPFHRQKLQAPLGPSDFLRRDKFIGLFTRVRRSPSFPHWCCSWMIHVPPERVFSTATTAMFGEKQTTMLHLWLEPTTLCVQRLGGYC